MSSEATAVAAHPRDQGQRIHPRPRRFLCAAPRPRYHPSRKPVQANGCRPSAKTRQRHPPSTIRRAGSSRHRQPHSDTPYHTVRTRRAANIRPSPPPSTRPDSPSGRAASSPKCPRRMPRKRNRSIQIPGGRTAGTRRSSSRRTGRRSCGTITRRSTRRCRTSRRAAPGCRGSARHSNSPSTTQTHSHGRRRANKFQFTRPRGARRTTAALYTRGVWANSVR